MLYIFSLPYLKKLFILNSTDVVCIDLYSSHVFVQFLEFFFYFFEKKIFEMNKLKAVNQLEHYQRFCISEVPV